MGNKEEEVTIQGISRSIDLLVITVANLFNLIMVGIFYLRKKNGNHPQYAAYVWALFTIILFIASVLNLRAKLNWWFIVLPLIFAAFLVLELLLDYILKINFRSTGLLAPYLILYYASILGMIGYAFLTQKRLGIITLATYFLSQIAAFYSYSKVGHG
jgi:hypothetical protein